MDLTLMCQFHFQFLPILDTSNATSYNKAEKDLRRSISIFLAVMQ